MKREALLAGGGRGAGLRRSAGTRIAVTAAALFLAATLVVGGGLVAATRAGMSQALDRRIVAAGDAMVAAARRGGRAAVVAAMRRQQDNGAGAIGLALYDRDGRSIAGRGDWPMPAPGWADAVLPDAVEGGDPARLLTIALPGGDRLMVAGNRRPLLMAQQAIGWLFLASLVSIAILCAAMGWLLARYIDRRLSPIVGTATAVIGGDLARRVPVGRHGDEFDTAALALNVMLDRIAGLMANLRQVTGDVAHDLRTPLTRIRLRLERAAGGPGADAAIRAAIVQLDELVAMFNAILRIAEIEGAPAARVEPVELEALVLDVTGSMRPVFEDAGIALRVRSDHDCVVMGDRGQIAAAVVNLLENVLRHAAGGSDAQVDLRTDGGAVVLTVRDTGPGVDDRDLARIFDRFVRLDGARTEAGHGLGLSLVKAVVQAHGGTVAAARRSPGLEVTIVLPAA
ncbi:hypothetical protein ASG29_03645 [Sphingomonas sp. Leaf412]|nr:hypothetical protein ASG29_03645 [Sphingomonas sp. Leaf412]